MIKYEFQNEQIKMLEQVSIMMDKIFYFVNKSNTNTKNSFYIKLLNNLKFQIFFYTSDPTVHYKTVKSFKLQVSNLKKDNKIYYRFILNYPADKPMIFSHNTDQNSNIEDNFYSSTEIILDQLKKLKIIE